MGLNAVTSVTEYMGKQDNIYDGFIEKGQFIGFQQIRQLVEIANIFCKFIFSMSD